LAVLGGIAWASTAGDEADSGDVPTRGVVQYTPPDHPVSASELWNETLSALNCFESHGVETVGPYPAADGSRVEYSIAASSEALDLAQECTGELEPLSRQFALDNAPEQAASQPERDASELPVLPVEARPATENAVELAAIADDLESCLLSQGDGVLDGADEGLAQDVALLTAAHDHPTEFGECVSGVG
jgi:hypothetical protein